jgi:hypothetical protein
MNDKLRRKHLKQSGFNLSRQLLDHPTNGEEVKFGENKMGKLKNNSSRRNHKQQIENF